MNTSTLLNAAKNIGVYVLVTFGTYFVAIIVWIILGYLQEVVIPNLGLNASGNAVTAINNLITAVGTAITAITAIVTVITGLLTLNVVLQAFGVKLNLNFSTGTRV